ncbi:membrane protein insertase YidC [Pararobbsia silviterrae]|uniref:Membrane protein insertase YidC n=1 Tax=Pararobbsia silviterrae TaxID=1792498 RepID=A0A494X054_9BURK|nr:membrane protein insertase YidC [Pararobbsia silviterrae]RKP44077.1 membrane protein insertase YidC [Pararobbsia silviterrae]
MDIKRSVLWVIFVGALVLLYNNWQVHTGHPSMFVPSQSLPHPAASGAQGANDVASTPAGAPAVQSGAPAAQAQLVDVKTDMFDARISTQGGTLERLQLLKEGDAKQPDTYVTLFDDTATHKYLARTGLVGGDFPNHTDVFTLVPGPTTLADGQDTLTVRFESPEKGGLKLVKTYTFTRGSYVIGVNQQIVNAGTAPANPSLYLELVRDSQPVETPRFSHTFIGPAVYTDQHHFQKITFSDIDKNKAEFATQADNGWVAMIQHYFATAWIPPQGKDRTYYVEKFDPTLYRVGAKVPLGTIAPGQSVDIDSKLFAGPEEEKMLAAVAPGLDLVKDYGWVTIIARPLFWLLEKIHGVIGNWGWSIIALTLLIKAVFFPLSAASYRSMAKMKEITPRMQALRERFKGDPQKMNAALMELYKTEKVNPLGGCLPVVIQIPVFISLYWVLLSSVEMRGAPWIGWIHDLSQQDPFFILPLLMAGSMFIQTRLNPTPPDPVQAKMMMFMPIAFSVMFFFFPAGLVLYYVVNNVLSIAQQYYITRMMGKGKTKKLAAPTPPKQ